MSAPACITIALFLLGFGSTAQANELHRMDLMSDGHTDRVTFEFDQRADYRMSSPDPNILEITFSDVELSPEFAAPSLPAGLTFIDRVSPRLNDKGKLVVTMHLQREADPTGITLHAIPWTYAMDLSPRKAGGGEAMPQYVPGDRPFHTRYSQANPDLKEASSGVHISNFSLILFMLLSYAMGVISVFAAGYGMHLWERRAHRVPATPPVMPAPSMETLNTELQRDLARLKRIVEWEQGNASETARRITEERERLILKLMREGQNLDAIAEVLEMTPAQVRSFLDRKS